MVKIKLSELKNKTVNPDRNAGPNYDLRAIGCRTIEEALHLVEIEQATVENLISAMQAEVGQDRSLHIRVINYLREDDCAIVHDDGTFELTPRGRENAEINRFNTMFNGEPDIVSFETMEDKLIELLMRSFEPNGPEGEPDFQ